MNEIGSFVPFASRSEDRMGSSLLLLVAETNIFMVGLGRDYTSICSDWCILYSGTPASKFPYN